MTRTSLWHAFLALAIHTGISDEHITNACRSAQALYARMSASLGSFHEPSRRWWQQRRVSAASKAERAELAALEARLSLEEVAHFRAGVAAVHSRLLAGNYAVLQVLLPVFLSEFTL